MNEDALKTLKLCDEYTKAEKNSTIAVIGAFVRHVKNIQIPDR